MIVYENINFEEQLQVFTKNTVSKAMIVVYKKIHFKEQL